MRKKTRNILPLLSLLMVVFFLLSPQIVMAVDEPSGLSADGRSHSEVSLTWVRGADATNTSIQMKTGGYPTDWEDGTRVYRGTGSSFLVEDLTAGTTYYIRAWGETAGVNSSGYSETVITTPAGVTPDEPLDGPTEPDDFVAPSSHENLSYLPIYDMVNDAADQSGFSQTFLWMFIIGASAVCAGVAVFVWSGSSGAGILTVFAGFGYGVAVEVYPWWAIATVITLVLFPILLRGRQA